jgi:hypothetical protein
MLSCGIVAFVLCACVFVSVNVDMIEGKFSSASGLYSNICKTTEDGRISNNNNVNAFNPNEVGTDTNAPYLQREIIVSSFEINAVLWAVNMLESIYKLARPLEKSGLTIDHPEVIFIVFDAQTLDLCDNLFLPCWFPKKLFALPPPSSNGEGMNLISEHTLHANFPSNPFRLQAIQRLRAVALLLSGGANVLFTEADVYWLRSPYPLLVNKPSNLLVSSHACYNVLLSCYLSCYLLAIQCRVDINIHRYPLDLT